MMSNGSRPLPAILNRDLKKDADKEVVMDVSNDIGKTKLSKN